jgi:hypothetical protein
VSERDKDDFTFMVTGYRFGAKRRPPGPAGARVTSDPPQSRDGATEEVTTVAA